MSTKLPHGLRIDSSHYDDVFDFADQARAAIDDVFLPAAAEYVADVAIRHLDRHRVGDTPESSYSPFDAVCKAMNDKTMCWDRLGGPLRVYKLPTGDFLGYLTGGNATYRKALLAMPGVTEYGFWNNTDCYPDGVTRADWKVREATWEATLPSGFFNRHGVAIDLPNTDDFMVRRYDDDALEALVAAQPSANSRAVRILESDRDITGALLSDFNPATDMGRAWDACRAVAQLHNPAQYVKGLVPATADDFCSTYKTDDVRYEVDAAAALKAMPRIRKDDALYSNRIALLQADPEEYFRQYPPVKRPGLK